MNATRLYVLRASVNPVQDAHPSILRSKTLCAEEPDAAELHPHDLLVWYATPGAPVRARMHPGPELQLSGHKISPYRGIILLARDAPSRPVISALSEMSGLPIRLEYTEADARAIKLFAEPLPFYFYRVYICFNGDQRCTTEIVLDIDSDHAEPRVIKLDTCWPAYTAVPDLVRRYKTMAEPMAWFVAYVRRAVDAPPPRLADGWRMTIDDFKRNVFVGPSATSAAQRRLVAEDWSAIATDIHPLSSNYGLPGFGIHSTDWFKWPLNVDRIIAFALATIDMPLPAYCMLWIFDRLPWARHFKEVQMIGMIEGIVASIRRVLAKRTETLKHHG